MSSNRKALSVLAAACTVGFGYMSFWEGRKYSKLSSKFNTVRSEIEKFEPFVLEGADAAVYPWYRNNNLEEEWEYKLVKIQGYFKEERFFIARERDGKKGYLVMAPFITSTRKYSKVIKPVEANKTLESGLLVNLGWVPAENKDDIELSAEPLPLIDPPAEGSLPERERFTGLTNNPSNLMEDDIVSLTEVVGIVRKGEQQDRLNRRVNWENHAVFQFIDLPYLARFFKFFNTDAASSAYIERIVPQYDEESETLYPVPATKDTFVRPEKTPSLYQKTASLCTGISAISLVTFLLTAVRR
mmetsp:Transcript_3902/g.4336  ORF Transcript_3902/g.4336 Transcript_3902/m.4336 type:complete len:300 (+) Transcript_3902:32-931(+)